MIYLASQSPRRRALLEQLGVAYELLLPLPDEDSEALECVLPNEAAVDYVQRVTRAKAQAAGKRLRHLRKPTKLILTADTTVALDGAILGKPADTAAALQMLTSLNGRTHDVLTAVALLDPETGVVNEALNRSAVTFGIIDPAELAAYAASGDPLDKAGAYGIQGAAGRFVERIDGSFSGIMGLPLFETHRLLINHATLLR
ncbi:MAG: Maf family protein [Burkholderiaceae bacterium]